MAAAAFAMMGSYTFCMKVLMVESGKLLNLLNERWSTMNKMVEALLFYRTFPRKYGMKFVKSYTVPESWENDEKGQYLPIYNAVMGEETVSPTEFLLFIAKNNNASSFKLNWMVVNMLSTPPAAENSAAFILRVNNKYKMAGRDISCWCSQGTVIDVYRIHFPANAPSMKTMMMMGDPFNNEEEGFEEDQLYFDNPEYEEEPFFEEPEEEPEELIDQNDADNLNEEETN